MDVDLSSRSCQTRMSRAPDCKIGVLDIACCGAGAKGRLELGAGLIV